MLKIKFEMRSPYTHSLRKDEPMQNTLENDLQKQLFFDGMRALSLPDWEILDENGLLAFKSPCKVPFMDFMYASVTQENFEKAKRFYLTKPFMWLLYTDLKAPLLSQWGFKGPEINCEMILSLAEYIPVATPSTIEIRRVTTQEDYKNWISTAADWLAQDVALVDEFFGPWIKKGISIPYLALLNREPAATSLLYCGSHDAAIYCLGTRQKFRRQGLGCAVTHACLLEAKNRNLSKATLYASLQGMRLYEKIGFKSIQTLYEYAYDPKNGA